jgi:type I restriction enzyme S subunit
MKDSGVEWLGQVPEHWSVPKVSHVFFLQSGDSITGAEIEEVGSYEVFGGNGLRGYTEKYNCEGTYNLIGRQGALCGNVHMVSGKFFASEHAIVVYPLKELDVAFYRYFLEFMNLGQYSTAAAQPGISVEVISQLRIAFPPAFEQNLISNFIHSNLSEIGQLQSECTDLINLLKERRSALISAAVTGKIDVRAWQPPAAQ